MLVILIFIIWFIITHPQIKICGFLATMVFAGIEWIFRGITGIIQYKVKPSLSTFLYLAYTTWEQWWMNLLLCSPLMYYLSRFVKELWLIILLFPLFCYCVEIIGGYFLIHIWGKRGWFYDDAYSLLNGNITLRFLPFWWILGAFHVFANRFIDFCL